MPPFLTPSRTILAVALALSTTVTAHAQTASANASLSNLKIELIDLDPADGIAPKLTLTPTERMAMYASAYYIPAIHNMGDGDYNSGYDAVSASIHAVDASGSASGDTGKWQAAASYANPASNSIYLVTDVFGTYQFKLTRATRMIVTADASVSGTGDGGPNQSEAWTRIVGVFDNGLDIAITDELSWAGTAADEQIGISMQTLYGSLYGTLTVSAGTKLRYDANALPVPEPGAPAMLLTGVAVLGAYARRKARRAA